MQLVEAKHLGCYRYYVNQTARTCLNRCLCALCHHPVPDYAHPHRQIYHREIPLGGLSTIFYRHVPVNMKLIATHKLYSP